MGLEYTDLQEVKITEDFNAYYLKEKLRLIWAILTSAEYEFT